MQGRGIWFESEPGVGFRLLTAKEQNVDKPAKLERAAARLNHKTMAIVGSIPDADLTDEERMLRDARVGLLAQQDQQLKTNKALVRSWLSSPAALPKPKAS